MPDTKHKSQHPSGENVTELRHPDYDRLEQKWLKYVSSVIADDAYIRSVVPRYDDIVGEYVPRDLRDENPQALGPAQQMTTTRELLEDYEYRISITEAPLFSEEAVREIQSFIASAEDDFAVSLGDSDGGDLWADLIENDADGEGSSFISWLLSNPLWSLITTGRVWLVVDNDVADGVESLEDEQRDRKSVV